MRILLHHLFVRASRPPRRIFNRLLRRDVVHFLHIGKTGGTAIREALGRGAAAANCDFVFHRHGTRLRDIPPGERVIFFVRDPISRFVSGFYSRQRQGKPRYSVPWSEGEKAAFDNFATPAELARALSDKCEIRRAEADHAMRSISHLRWSYWFWFQNERYLKMRRDDIWFVGFQERLDTDFAILKERLGLPADLQLPTDDATAHRNPTGLDLRLDDLAISNLKLRLARDYDFVRCCGELIPQNARLDPAG